MEEWTSGNPLVVRFYSTKSLLFSKMLFRDFIMNLSNLGIMRVAASFLVGIRFPCCFLRLQNARYLLYTIFYKKVMK